MAEKQPKVKGRSPKSKALKQTVAITQSAAETSENTFSDLHQKIQAKFHKIQETKKTKTGPSRAKPSGVPNGSETPSKEHIARGKKRSSNGAVVDRTAKSKPDVPVRIPNKATENESSTLEDEVHALGGTREDLDLLDGVDSDSELEGVEGEYLKTTKEDGPKSLHKGMSNILKEIALAQGHQDSSSESPAPSDSETGDGDLEMHTVTKSKPQLEPAPAAKKGRGSHSNLRCEPQPDWFNYAPPIFDAEKNPEYTLSDRSLDELQRYGRSLLEAENDAFKQNHQSSSSHNFYNTVIQSGTLSDKISALTLAAQESPVHNVRALESLIGLAKKRSRTQAIDVLRALKDLFAQGSLLPSDRRLYTFSAQPALMAGFGKVKSWKSGDNLPDPIEETHLILWTFENWLKEQYFDVLKTLEIWCNDEIEFSKSRAVNYVFELLREKPEQESNLLRLLINKLGDPIKKIASQTSYLLMQLLAAHPAMKNTVITAIEVDFIFRPGQSIHAKYYAAVTLNQTVLSSQEGEAAIKLLDIYFGLFVGLLKAPEETTANVPGDGLTRGEQRRRKHKIQRSKDNGSESQEGELREKLISAVLTGINRAYPYTDKSGHDLAVHLNTLFKITHSSNFNTSIQAMMLIQQLSTSHQASSDRFYRTLYESLLDPRLVTSSKQQLYLNLVHRSLKADVNLKRVKAFVKRILQIFTIHEPSFICGAFFLLNDLQATFPSLRSLIEQPEDHDNDEEVFRDVDDGETPRHPQREAMLNPVPSNAYDPRKRDPEHSNADNSCTWDIFPFLAHFHPTVTVSADSFLRQAKLPGKPDLTLHTLSHFLDRFVYRNPKLASTNLRGSSIMQPIASDDAHAVLISNAAGKRRVPVNSEEFRQAKDSTIAAEDVFFHKYFNSVGKEPSKKKTKKEGHGGVDADSSDVDEEDEVWKAMRDSAPDLEGEEDESDQDLEMSDLESDFDQDELDGMSESNEEGMGVDVDVETGIFDESADEIVDFNNAAESIAESEDVESEEQPVKKIETTKSESKAAASREQRRKMKALPTFASASDYAKMLADDDDEDMG